MLTLLIVGALGFSNLSAPLIEGTLGLPIYLPEIVWLPLMLLIPGRFWSSLPRLATWPAAWLAAAVFVSLLLAGLFVTGDLFEVVRSSRPFAYIFALILSVQLCSDTGLGRLMVALFWLSVGALVGEAVNVTMISGLEGLQSSVNIPATVVVVGSLAYGTGLTGKLLAAVVGAAAVFLSGFRVVLLAVGFAFTAPLILEAARYVTRRRVAVGLKRVGLGVGTLAVLAVLSQPVWAFIAESFPSRWFRIVTRVVRFFALGIRGSQDVTRIEAWKTYFGSLTASDLVPKGFITTGQHLVGLYNDVPIAQLIDMFGILAGAGVVVVLFFFLPFRALVEEIRVPSSTTGVANVFTMFLPFLLSVNGRVFYITFEAVLFGLLLGVAARSWRGERDDLKAWRASL